MSTSPLEVIERAVVELLAAFDVERPPIPIEIMLQRPRNGMWREVNLSELSISFIKLESPFSPRMAIARLLARHACRSSWGTTRGLGTFADDDTLVRAFARALLMPQNMMMVLPETGRSVQAVSQRFEVPEADAVLRLNELGLSAANVEA
ncbi:MAG: hypothetical protein OHK0023_23250 [Anaerolineae bacterium]